MPAEINYLGVLVASVAAFALGALWYSPVLFGRQWQALMGFTPEVMKSMRMAPVKAMAFGFLTTIVMVFVLAHVSIVWGVKDAADAVTLAFWIWLGFQAPLLAHSVLWENRSPMLYLLNAGHSLVSTMVAAVVLTVIG